MPFTLADCLFSMLLFSSFLFVRAVECIHCAGTIPACTEGHCPLVEVVASNAAGLLAGNAGSIVLFAGLPMILIRIFNRRVLDRITRLRLKFKVKVPFDPSGKPEVELFDAWSEGEYTSKEFNKDMARRLLLSTDDVERENIKALMAAVTASPAKTDKESTDDEGAVGPYDYTWGKCVEYVQGPARGGGSSSKDDDVASKNASLYPKNRTPKSAENFFEAINLFLLISSATGLINPIILGSFLQKVVYEPMRNKGYSWMMAHELLMAYLSTVQRSDDPSISLANVYERGGLDSHCEQACKTGPERFGNIFRKSPGEPSGRNGSKIQGDDKLIWNKKFTKKSKAACEPFNRGEEHSSSHLHPDGTCKFMHGCSRWVTDKGPRGKCLSTDHKWGKCDNPNKCDDPVA